MRFVKIISSAITLGTLAGSGLAIASIQHEHHLDHAHYGQALGLWVQIAIGSVAAALISAAVATGFYVIASLAAQRLASALGPARASTDKLIRLSTFLLAALPVWVVMPLQERALFPTGKAELVACLTALGLFHVLAFAANSRWQFVPSETTIRTTATLAAALLLALTATERLKLLPGSDAGSRPNVLLIVLDTVRADRLSSYGYDQPTTPELDSFSDGAIRFSNFYSTSSWTVPSHASLFTGLYPIRHGATQENLSLKNEFATLAETLGNAGYQTFAASQNPFVSDTVNLAQGFDEFAPLWRDFIKPDGSIRHARRDGHLVNNAFEAYLERSNREEPFFAFLNYIDAHLPTAPPEPYLSKFLRPGTNIDDALRIGRERWSGYYSGKEASAQDLEVLSDLYNAELAYMSYQLKELFDRLREDGRFDNTLIVVTSDHGEQLGDHEHLGHMFSLYNTTVRVPLIIRLPGNAAQGRVDDRLGQLVDLYPTIMRIADVDYADSTIHGVDLMSSSSDAQRDFVFSEYYYPSQALAMYGEDEHDSLSKYRRRLRAIEADGMRLIWSSLGDHELFDLQNDPGETTNLFAQLPGVAARLKIKLNQQIENYGTGYKDVPEAIATAGARLEVDNETEAALRELGYLQ
jgi:arylsulfatase A-like enzyme